jgi:lysophospholipase L1-like esterase
MHGSVPSDGNVSTHQPSPGMKRLFRRIVLVGVVSFIGLATISAEMAARYYERRRSTPPDYFPSIYYPHRRLRYGLVPNTDYYGWFKINSLGFRGREISAQKKPGVLRIVCLGGSTTFDTGTVGAARPWPEVLEAELRQRMGTMSLEVLNLGIPGATSLDSLIDLQMRAFSFEPDLVIVYQGHNDLVYSIPPPTPEPSLLFPLEDPPRSRFTRWLTYHSLLYAKTEERVAQRISGVLNVFEGSTATESDDEAAVRNRVEAMERGVSEFRRNLISIAAISRAHNVPLVLVQIAVPFPPDGPAQSNCEVCRGLSAAYGGVDVAHLKLMFSRYNDVLVQVVALGSGVHYIPTDGFVSSIDRYYKDPVHFGPDGSLRMGLKLGEALEPIVRGLGNAPSAAGRKP